MAQPLGAVPFGARGTDGVVHRPSPFSVAGTVERLGEVIEGAGAKLFAVIDHSGEAERAGLAMRDTKLVIFGNPVAGTPIMQASPLAALDLPLKVLVWADDQGDVWMSYLEGTWLAHRHGIAVDRARPLSAPEALTGRVASAA